MADSAVLPAEDHATFLDPKDAAITALPSPAATPRDVEDDSGTEIEAPSISDWEPTSDTDPIGGLDGYSESEVRVSVCLISCMMADMLTVVTIIAWAGVSSTQCERKFYHVRKCRLDCDLS
jgi:hypothetical protein